jgi:hypothetical protein
MKWYKLYLSLFVVFLSFTGTVKHANAAFTLSDIKNVNTASIDGNFNTTGGGFIDQWLNALPFTYYDDIAATSSAIWIYASSSNISLFNSGNISLERCNSSFSSCGIVISSMTLSGDTPYATSVLKWYKLDFSPYTFTSGGAYRFFVNYTGLNISVDIPLNGTYPYGAAGFGVGSSSSTNMLFSFVEPPPPTSSSSIVISYPTNGATIAPNPIVQYSFTRGTDNPSYIFWDYTDIDANARTVGFLTYVSSTGIYNWSSGLQTGRYTLSGALYNSSGTLLQQLPIYPFGGVDITISTSTAGSSADICAAQNFGTVANGVCNAFLFLFNPSQNSLAALSSIKDLISNKPPLGYVTAFISGLTLTTSTAAFSVSSSTLAALSSFTSPIRAALAWILWVMFGLWILKRFIHVHL